MKMGAPKRLVHISYTLFLLALVEVVIWSIPLVDSATLISNNNNNHLQTYFSRETEITGTVDSSIFEKDTVFNQASTLSQSNVEEQAQQASKSELAQRISNQPSKTLTLTSLKPSKGHSIQGQKMREESQQEQIMAAEPPAIREKGRCAGTMLVNISDNPTALPSPWNERAFPAPPDLPICDEYQDTGICCQPAQIQGLVSNMQQAASILARCPSCFNNFKRFWCLMTCSPDQSLYLTALELKPNGVIANLGMNISIDFAQQFYDSCKDTKMAATGLSVMVAFGNAKNYQEFIGNLANTSALNPPLGASMQITPSFTTLSIQNITSLPSDTSAGMSGPLEPCNTTCSCTDCPSTCPPLKIPPAPRPTVVHIGHLKVPILVFVTAIVGIVLALFIIAFAVVIALTKPKYNEDERLSLLSSTLNINNNDKFERGAHKQSGLMALLSRYFRMHGKFMARHPFIVLIASLVFTGFCAAWIYKLQIITRPESLWVPPGSLTAKDKQYSDEQFGPFYRIEQSIIRKSVNSNSPILNKQTLLDLYDAYNHLRTMVVPYTPKNSKSSINITLDDICFKPMLGKGCLVESPLGWFQNNLQHIQWDYGWCGDLCITSHLSYCFEVGKFQPSCMTDIGTPVDAQVVLGGYFGTNYIGADTVVMTVLVENHVDESKNDMAKAWEAYYVKYWESLPLAKKNFTVAFSAQRSIEDELARESDADIPTVVISYSAMFLYVAVALGTLKRPIFIHSKILLAFGGILVVIFSIFISVGLCSLFGVAATLIISEVIPFLVLAIGVDNIFILVDTYQTTDPKESVEERLGETLAQVGSSIAMASLSEAAAFLLGMLTRMPAVVAFSVYSSVAILFDFLLQITFFAALVALDAERQRVGRYDVLPCIKSSSHQNAAEDDYSEYSVTSENGSGGDVDGIHPALMQKSISNKEFTALDGDEMIKQVDEDDKKIIVNGFVSQFFFKFYSPVVFHPVSKIIVLLIFLAMFIAGINLAPKVELGLPQQVALPQDSFLISYFDQLAKYGRAGPPVYFVMKSPFDYTKISSQNLLCSVDGTECKRDSVDNAFYTATRLPGTSFVSNSTLSSWLDTYLIWLRPTTGCCNVMPNGTFCPIIGETPLPPECKPCLTKADFQNNTNRPTPEVFMKYFSTWLTTICSNRCGSCGSVFAMDIKLDHSKPSTSPEFIHSTRFRAFHRDLSTQSDFISGLKEAYSLTDNLKSNLGIEIFPYSVFYIFFEQYMYIEKVAAMCIGLAIAAVFVVTLILLGNVFASFLIICTVFMIEVDLLGVMTLWNINLNAVSVVNLVMAIGISVEFCVHMLHSYITHDGSRKHRAKLALVEMGSSVLKGITLTKFAGVIVLAFAKSEIFKVYYFRMFFTIVILGCLHGLVLLPTILSIFGPRTRRSAFQLW